MPVMLSSTVNLVANKWSLDWIEHRDLVDEPTSRHAWVSDIRHSFYVCL